MVGVTAYAAIISFYLYYINYNFGTSTLIYDEERVGASSSIIMIM